MNPLYDDLPLLSQGDELGPSIRLLRLRGTAPQVTNKLEVFLLQKCPEYKALSYCWGDAVDTLPLRVQCNDLDFTLDITRNLHSALEYLQFEYPDQLLWIDAICINQQDKTEREHQVAIMRDIYSRAEEVLIWLGLSIVYGNAHLAFSACEKFVSLWRPYVHYLASRGMKDHNRIANVAVDMALRSRPFTGAESDALIEILRQPYWSRLWIIQEMCVPKAVRIHEGRQSISWGDFKLVLVMMERCMLWVQRILDSNFCALLELRRCYHEEDPATRPQLPELLALFRWSRATNKLDKIYGLLGLAPSHERDLVKIEYNILPSKCYTRVMFALLQQRRDLSLLMDCKVPSFVCRQPLLPSWVPDWSYDASNLPSTRLGLSEGNRYHAHSVTHKGIYQGYQASGSSECPMPRIRDDGNGVVLTLHGMVAAEAIIQVAPAMGLHHQLLHVVKHRGLSVPVSPFESEESTNIHGIRFIWRVLTTTSISSFLMPPWNCYRRGAALDVLLASARLAQFPGTYLGEEKDILRVLFITMMKGPRGHEFIQDRVKDFHSHDVTQEITNQFRNVKNSLRWNVLLRLTPLFPPVHHFLLGLSYDHHRGMFHLSGYIIGLLHLIILRFGDYILIPHSILIPLMIYGLYMSARPIFVPVQPNRIDLVMSAVLDYRLARIDEGRLALVPHNAQAGDRIALLKGGKCPFVVRSQGTQWILIGDSYVYGMMEGEKWQEEGCQEMEFV